MQLATGCSKESVFNPSFGEMHETRRQFIEAHSIDGMTLIELYEVVGARWLECSSETKVVLLSHGNDFIRREAQAQQKAFSWAAEL